MLDIVKFYFDIVGKVFGIYNNFEIFPGVSFLAFMCACSIILILLSVIFHNVKEEYDFKYTRYKHDKWDSDQKRTYAKNGKHAYVSRHGKD
ncbi:MAG: hypothetical protein IJO43_02230 [Bacilli bacterium]|nr:hypothetical protein [Bacilli bacterium]